MSNNDCFFMIYYSTQQVRILRSILTPSMLLFRFFGVWQRVHQGGCSCPGYFVLIYLYKRYFNTDLSQQIQLNKMQRYVLYEDQQPYYLFISHVCFRSNRASSTTESTVLVQDMHDRRGSYNIATMWTSWYVIHF